MSTTRADQDRRRCSRCGRSVTADRAWTWSRTVDTDGRTTYLCPDCARSHARDIETKLDDEWW